MKNLFLFLFLLVVFTSKAQDNRVSGLNSRQFTKYCIRFELPPVY